jgi:MFS family permease
LNLIRVMPAKGQDISWMQTSVFLARLIGPVCLAVGIGLFANRLVYEELAREVLKSRALIYLTGLLSMTAGLAVVLSHNVWTADWRVLVTLLGWLAAIGGAVRIVLPQGTESIGRRVLEHPQGLTIAGVVWLALGAILSFFGYFR